MTDLLTRAGFEELVAPLRRELHAHCYRMLGSPHDADDALQDALTKAWRAAASFEGRSSLRTWLYAVATRCCLDAVRARGRRALPVDLGPAAGTTLLTDVARTDVAWLEPYPAGAAGPESRLLQRETVELAFVAALQHVPGNQRAALLLFDVLGFSAAEIADIMQTTTASVTSALQRARAVVADRAPRRGNTGHAEGDARTRALAADLADALERGDTEGFIGLLGEDVTWAMPPLPGWYAGRGAVVDFARRVPFGGCGSWRARPVVANGVPAFALWLRPPGGEAYGAWSINVLDTRDGQVVAITSFLDAYLFAGFGLPATLT